MFQILTPDINATIDVDIIREKLESDRIILLRMEIEKKEDEEYRNKAILQIDTALQNLPQDRPIIKIGFLPAAKKNELDHRQFILSRRVGVKEPTIEEIEEGKNISREWIRWGVKGHTIPFNFDTIKVSYMGRDYDLVGPLTLDMYERNDLLFTLRRLIENYNVLSQEKKLQSLSKSGITQPISTVNSVKKNLSCENSKDVVLQES